MLCFCFLLSHKSNKNSLVKILHIYYITPFTSCPTSFLHLRKHLSIVTSSLSVTYRGAGRSDASRFSVSSPALVEAPTDLGEFGVDDISTSQSPLSIKGGVACMNCNELSKISLM